MQQNGEDLYECLYDIPSVFILNDSFSPNNLNEDSLYSMVFYNGVNTTNRIVL